jgi:hypothetical protein
VDPSRRRSIALAVQVFVANHILLTIISLLTGRLFYDVVGQVRDLFPLWERWDVLWYERVAVSGYSWHPPPVQSDVAFFPLYPLSMHVLSVLTPMSAYAAGLVVANLSFLGALYVLHRLVLMDFDGDVADRTVYYLGIFPTALFFFTAYSEAPYLLCCAGCFYALRLRRWWLAGLIGMAATLTRQLGVLLVLPFVVEVFASWHGPRWTGLWSRLWPVLLLPAGLLSFMAYLQVRFGNALLFFRAQAAWNRVLAPPWQGVLDDFGRILQPVTGYSAHTQGSLQVQSLMNVAFALLFVGLVVFGVKILPLSYTAYGGGVLLAILMSPTAGTAQPLALLSIARFEVTLFPPFIVLGLAGRSRSVDRLIIICSVGLLTLFTIVFVRGKWIA